MTTALRVQAVPEPFTKCVSAVGRLGTARRVEVGMQRIRIERKPMQKQRPLPKVLPLDARDPDILHAKAIQERYLPPRRRAA
jgi:hypothetical protein